MNALAQLFDTSGFTPRWICGLWTDAHGWTYIGASLGVWSAYTVIPCVLGYSLSRRRETPFRGIFVLFLVFILTCGLTHLMDAVLFWWPAYRLSALLILATAVVSWVTVVAMVPTIPKLLAMRSPAELEREISARIVAEEALRRANTELEGRVETRTLELARANDELRREREWFRITLSSIGDAVIATEGDGRIRFMNRVAETLTGWSSDEACGLRFAETIQLVEEGSRRPWTYPVGKDACERRAGVVTWQNVLMGRPGGVTPVEIATAPIIGDFEPLAGTVVTFRDVTREREALQRARRTEDRLRALVEASSQIVWTTNAEGQVVEDSPSWRAFTGQTLEQWQGPGRWEATHPEDRDRIEAAWQAAVAARQPFHEELRIRRADGVYRWMAARGTPVREPDGTIREWVGMNTDVTEQRRAAEGAARLAAIVESSGDAIIAKNLDGTITSWNAGAERLFGYKAEEMLGRSVAMLIPADRQDEEASILDQIRRGEPVETFESVRMAKGNRLIDVSLSVSPVRDAEGRIIGASKIARDITERKRSEDEMRATQGRLEALSRQLLRVQEDERRRIARELHDEVGQCLTAAKIAVDRAAIAQGAAIGPRLADASLLIAGALDLIRNLSRLLRPSILDDLGLEAALLALTDGISERTGLAVEAEIDPEVGRLDPEVEVACYRIAQEALNNAVKHARATRLRVSLRREGENVELVVADDGAGFDVAKETARAASGASLGLLGLAERANLAGGRTEIESTHGAGTRVRAWLSAVPKLRSGGLLEEAR